MANTLVSLDNLNVIGLMFLKMKVNNNSSAPYQLKLILNVDGTT